MKLKDIKILKTKSKAELQAMLPELIRKSKELKLKQESRAEVKYQIALIKTVCSKYAAGLSMSGLCPPLRWR